MVIAVLCIMALGVLVNYYIHKVAHHYMDDTTCCVQDCCPLDCQDSETCTAYCCDGVSEHDCKSPCCNGE